MGSRFPLVGILAVFASALLAGCGETNVEARGGNPSLEGAALDAANAKKKPGSKLKLVDSEYGRAVMNGRGRALYLFDKETTGTPQCYGDCAIAWPPFLTKGKPVAGEGLDPKLVGSSPRSDGTRQVTYRGHPLYLYEHDTPGVILCQDVFEFGGNWLLVNRRGNAIH